MQIIGINHASSSNSTNTAIQQISKTPVKRDTSLGNSFEILINHHINLIAILIKTKFFSYYIIHIYYTFIDLEIIICEDKH